MSSQTQRRNFLAKSYFDIGEIFHSLRIRKVEWIVVSFAVGIGVYFSLPIEPRIWVIAIPLIFLLVVAAKYRDFPFFLILIMFLAGIGRSTWHSRAVNAPILPSVERAYTIKGWITAVEKPSSRFRWVIAVDEISGLGEENTPNFIRTTIYDNNHKAGDKISITAVLRAPPDPVIPGGYDTARAGYFRQIGAYGYAISKAESVDFQINSFSERIQRIIVQMRYGLAERILKASPEETGGLQVALLTGIRTYIPQQHTDALRTAGLTHVLAISGLHM